MPEAPKNARSGALFVAAGILASRVMGLVRQKLFSHWLGVGPAAAAFAAALRIPNFLQNLLGEGVLSASFIPVYAGLRAQKKDVEAEQVAGAVFGLLALAVSLLTALGIVFARPLTAFIALGFSGEQLERTVELTRVLFPGTACLVMGAWCLGVLNSHRRFFLSYVAPVLWNLCIIAALIVFRHEDAQKLAWWTAAGAATGGLVQFSAQLPMALKLLGHFRPSLKRSPEVLTVLAGFGPALVARGVVQLSAWVDTQLATLVSERALAALTNAFTVSLLPVSLFGMAISAAELPELSADATQAAEERAKALRTRIDAGLTRLVFFVIPSAAAFLLIGEQLSELLFEGGAFTAKDSRYVWYLLMGSGIGLVAQTAGRLYSSAFYALKDTRTPLKFAVIRVALASGLGFVSIRWVPGWLNIPNELGAPFMVAAAGFAAWVEFTLLQNGIRARIGQVGLPFGRVAKLWACALVAGAAAIGLKIGLVHLFGANPDSSREYLGELLPPPAFSPNLTGLFCVAAFGLVYLLTTTVAGVGDAKGLINRVLRRR